MVKPNVHKLCILIGVSIVLLTILNHHMFRNYYSIENFDNNNNNNNNNEVFNFGNENDNNSNSYINTNDYKENTYKSQITRDMIPKGQEDLYILKSEIVPPVCPACPPCASKPSCPPCPPCKRCPKPAYTCKLVPDYNQNDVKQAVKPFLTDFSKFEDL